MGRISLWAYVHWILLTLVCYVLTCVTLANIVDIWLNPGFLFFLGTCSAGYVHVRYTSTELAVTSKRLIVKVGIFWRSTSELYLTRIEGVEVEQSILGRILGYGTIYVRGVGTEIAPVANISQPILFRKAFFEAADIMLEAHAQDGGY